MPRPSRSIALLLCCNLLLLLLPLEAVAAAPPPGVCTLLDSFRARYRHRANQEFGTYDSQYVPDSNLKHTPVASVAGTEVKVSLPLHPTAPEEPHFIDGLYVEDQDGVVIAAAELGPTSAHPPAMRFAVPPGTRSVTPFAHCNKHGLFRGDPVATPSSDPRAPPCALISCLSDAAAAPCPQLAALALEAKRRDDAGVFNKVKPDGHTPAATVSAGGRVRVTVGINGATHTQHDPTDAELIHYIEAAWVTDQTGAVVGWAQFSPVDNPPVAEFDMPSGTTSVTPHILCNVHGLWTGATVSVAASQSGQQVEPHCVVTACLRPAAGYSHCPLLETQFVATLQRHAAEQGVATAFYAPGGNEKHTPRLSISGSTATVTVGSPAVLHPMDAEQPHYIDTVFAVDQWGAVVFAARLSPLSGVPAQATFELPTSVTALTPYAYCNTHGLFRGSPAEAAQQGLVAVQCRAAPCFDTPSLPQVATGGSCPGFDVLAREAQRRQDTAGLTGSADIHTPIAIAAAGRVRVTVGVNGKQHTQHDPTDPELLHYIEAIWITDQNGAVIGWAQLSPLDNPPAAEFPVSTGTTSVTPHAYCNLHGLWAGAAVTTIAGGELVERGCAVAPCLLPPRRPESCPLYESMRVALTQRHTSDHGTAEPFFQPTANAKHTPLISISGAVVTVSNAGPPKHPMDPGQPHYIGALYVVDQNNVVVSTAAFAPTSPPPAQYSFALPAGVWEVIPYSFCNIHGLFRGGPLRVPPADAAAADSVPVPCGVQPCGGSASVPLPGPDGRCGDMESLASEYRRRQSAEGLSGSTDVHTPAAVVTAGGRVRVTVGVNGQQHTQHEPRDPALLHYIEAIWVVDQSNTVVGFALLSPLDNPPVAEFDIPTGTASVTPLMYCNKHGLWEGAPVAVAGASAPRRCGLSACLAAAELELAPQAAPTEVVVTPAPTIECPNGSAPSTLALPSWPRGSFECQVGTKLAGVRLHWAVDSRRRRVAFGVVSPGTGWVGLAFPEKPGEMVPAWAVIGWAGTCGETAKGYQLKSQSVGGVQSGTAADAALGLVSAEASEEGGGTVLRVTRGLCGEAEDGSPLCIDTAAVLNLNIAYHPSADRLVAHPANRMTSLTLVLGDGGPAPPIEPPADGCRPSDLADEPQGNTMFDCMYEIARDWTLHWTYTAAADGSTSQGQVSFGVRSGYTGWAALGFPQEAGVMIPAVALVGWGGADGGGTSAVQLRDRSPALPADPSAAEAELGLSAGSASAEETGGATVVRFRRGLCGADGCIDPTALHLNLARHPTSDAFVHHEQNRASVVLDLVGGGAAAGSVRDLTSARRWHGGLMAAAWLVCSPSAMIIMRYGKPVFGLGRALRQGGKGAMLHIFFAVSAVGLTATGVALAFRNWYLKQGAGAQYGHSELGLALFGLVLAQPLIGAALALLWEQKDQAGRPQTRLVHIVIGRTLVMAAPVQCMLGVYNLKRLGDPWWNEYRTAVIAAGSFMTGIILLCEWLRRSTVIKRFSASAILEPAMSSEYANEKITLAEVRPHCIEDDCWIVIEGKVVDVSGWLDHHPGGRSHILSRAGRDATEAFNRHRHSDDARKILRSLVICEVEDARTSNAITLLEEVCNLLTQYKVEEAALLIPAPQNEYFPEGVIHVLTNLVSNLEACLPFLPEYLRNGSGDLSDSDALAGRDETVEQAFVRRRHSSARNRPAPDGKDWNGCVAICFTDVVSSTAIWEAATDAMSHALKLHNAVIRQAIADSGGYEVKTVGDAFMVAFDTCNDAVYFGLQAHQRLVDADWPEELYLVPQCAPQRTADGSRYLWRGLKLRIGVHWGYAELEVSPISRRTDYFGPTVNKASRCESSGSAGCVAVTQEVVKELTGVDFAPEKVDKLQLDCIGAPCAFYLGARDMKGCKGKIPLIGLIPNQLAERKESCMAEAQKKMTEPQLLRPPDARRTARQIAQARRLRLTGRQRSSLGAAGDAGSSITGDSGQVMSPHLASHSSGGLGRRDDSQSSLSSRRSQPQSGSGNLAQPRLRVAQCATLLAVRSLAMKATEWRVGLQAVLLEAEDAAHKTGGTVLSTHGTCVYVAFNIVRNCPGHVLQSVRCVSALSRGFEQRMTPLADSRVFRSFLSDPSWVADIPTLIAAPPAAVSIQRRSSDQASPKAGHPGGNAVPSGPTSRRLTGEVPVHNPCPRRPMAMAVVTGAMAHGPIRGRKTFHLVLCGPPVLAVEAVAQVCEELGTDCLVAELPGSQGGPSHSVVGPLTRPVEVLVVPQVSESSAGEPQGVAMAVHELHLPAAVRTVLGSPVSPAGRAQLEQTQGMPPGLLRQNWRCGLLRGAVLEALQELVRESACDNANLARHGSALVETEGKTPPVETLRALSESRPEDVPLSRVVARLSGAPCNRTVAWGPSIEPDLPTSPRDQPGTSSTNSAGGASQCWDTPRIGAPQSPPISGSPTSSRGASPVVPAGAEIFMRCSSAGAPDTARNPLDPVLPQQRIAGLRRASTSPSLHANSG